MDPDSEAWRRVRRQLTNFRSIESEREDVRAEMWGPYEESSQPVVGWESYDQRMCEFETELAHQGSILADLLEDAFEECRKR